MKDPLEAAERLGVDQHTLLNELATVWHRRLTRLTDSDIRPTSNVVPTPQLRKLQALSPWRKSHPRIAIFEMLRSAANRMDGSRQENALSDADRVKVLFGLEATHHSKSRRELWTDATRGTTVSFSSTAHMTDEAKQSAERRWRQRLYAELVTQLIYLADEGFPNQERSSSFDGDHPHDLPARLRTFVGRQEALAELDSLSNAGTVNVSGAPGTGKTSVALDWAHTNAERFVDGQLFVDLQGHGPLPPLDPDAVIRHLLQRFGLSGDAVPDESALLRAAYRSALSRRTALVILDNALDSEQVLPLLPGSGNSRMVITSRRSLEPLRVYPGIGVMEVKFLGLEESVELLDEYVRDDRVAQDRRSAESIARTCGGLPLALSIVGARIARRGTVPLSSAARQLAEMRRTVLDELPSEPGQHSVRIAFDWSFEQLSSTDQAQFMALCDLPFAEISEDLVFSVFESAGLKVMSRLVGDKLLTEVREGRYRIHDLIRLYGAEACELQLPSKRRSEITSRAAHSFLQTLRQKRSAFFASIHPRFVVDPLGRGRGLPSRRRTNTPRLVFSLNDTSNNPVLRAQHMAKTELLSWFALELPNVRSLMRWAKVAEPMLVPKIAFHASVFLLYREDFRSVLKYCSAGLAVLREGTPQARRLVGQLLWLRFEMQDARMYAPSPVALDEMIEIVDRLVKVDSQEFHQRTQGFPRWSPSKQHSESYLAELQKLAATIHDPELAPAYKGVVLRECAKNGYFPNLLDRDEPSPYRWGQHLQREIALTLLDLRLHDEAIQAIRAYFSRYKDSFYMVDILVHPRYSLMTSLARLYALTPRTHFASQKALEFLRACWLRDREAVDLLDQLIWNLKNQIDFNPDPAPIDELQEVLAEFHRLETL